MVICVGGVDLAGSCGRVSGVAVACDGVVWFVGGLHGDDEIVGVLLGWGVRVVAVDAPLSLPRSGWLREVDREMRRRGFRVLPPMWRGMRMLTLRGIQLSRVLEEYGVQVIETHPSSAVKCSGCSSAVEAACRVLDCSLVDVERLGRDEVDALVCAAVAHAYAAGRVVAVEAKDGVIYLLPRLC